MEIKFYAVNNGKKFYKVILHGEEIFCGTKGECQRFAKIHNEKVQRTIVDTTKSRQGNSRPRPGRVRVYRRRSGAPTI